jgi:hypothetical protein
LRENFDLVEAITRHFDHTPAEARVMIRLGQVKVNGRTERRLTLPPGQYQIDLPPQRVKHTPNSRG